MASGPSKTTRCPAGKQCVRAHVPQVKRWLTPARALEGPATYDARRPARSSALARSSSATPLRWGPAASECGQPLARGVVEAVRLSHRGVQSPLMAGKDVRVPRAPDRNELGGEGADARQSAQRLQCVLHGHRPQADGVEFAGRSSSATPWGRSVSPQ